MGTATFCFLLSVRVRLFSASFAMFVRQDDDDEVGDEVVCEGRGGWQRQQQPGEHARTSINKSGSRRVSALVGEPDPDLIRPTERCKFARGYWRSYF